MKTLTLKELYGKEDLQELLRTPEQAHVPNGFHFKNLKNEFINGTLYKYQDDTIIVSYQDWKLYQPFKLRIRHKNQLIKVQLEIEGNSSFESLKNESINIPCNHYQFIYIPKADGYLTYNCSRKVLDIYIDIDFLFQLLKTQGYSDDQLKQHFLLNNYTFYRNAIIITETQKQLIQQLLNHSYQSDFAKQFIRIKAIEIILSVFVGAANQINSSKWSDLDIEKISKVRNYLDSNYQEDLSLKVLTRKFGINEFKLKTAYKDLIGDTVFGYIRKQRLKKAQELLLNSDLEIKEIAFLTGFKYSHHFSKLYFDHYKIRPSEFRIQQGIKLL